MKPVQIRIVHWVNQCDLTQFIVNNSEMHWNEVVSYTEKHGFFNNDGASSFYSRKDFDELEQGRNDYNDEIVKWMYEFFKAHPQLTGDIYIVFDD